MSKTVVVCQHETCSGQGASAVYDAFCALAPPGVTVRSTGCLGECGSGPMAVVLPEETWYYQLTPKEIPAIAAQHLVGGKPVRKKLYPKYHASRQSVVLWLVGAGLCFLLLGLFSYYLASQTHYF